MKIGDAIYDPQHRALFLDGQETRLEPRLASLLEVLADQPEKLISREELLDRIWADEGSDEALTQAVSRLRQLLGNRELIRTEPRQGYRLISQPTPADRPVIRAQAITPSASARPITVRNIFLLGMAAGLAMALIIALLLWPRQVTVYEEVTQPVDGSSPPVTRTVRCDGDVEDCGEQPGNSL